MTNLDHTNGATNSTLQQHIPPSPKTIQSSSQLQIISTCEFNDSATIERASTQIDALPPTPQPDYSQFLEILCAFLLSRTGLLIDRTMTLFSLAQFLLVFFTIHSTHTSLIQYCTYSWDSPLLSTIATFVQTALFFGLSFCIPTVLSSVNPSSVAFFSLIIISKLTLCVFKVLTMIYSGKRDKRSFVHIVLVAVSAACYVPLLILSKSIQSRYWIASICVDIATTAVTSEQRIEQHVKRNEKLSIYLLIFSTLVYIKVQFTALVYATGVLALAVIFMIALSLSVHKIGIPAASFTLEDKNRTLKHAAVKVAFLMMHCAIVVFGLTLNLMMQQLDTHYSSFVPLNAFVYTPSISMKLNGVDSGSVVGTKIPLNLLPRYPAARSTASVVTNGSAYLQVFNVSLNQEIMAVSFIVIMVSSLVVYFGRGGRLREVGGTVVIRALVAAGVGLVSFLNVSSGILMFVEASIVIVGLGIERVCTSKTFLSRRIKG